MELMRMPKKVTPYVANPWYPDSQAPVQERRPNVVIPTKEPAHLSAPQLYFRVLWREPRLVQYLPPLSPDAQVMVFSPQAVDRVDIQAHPLYTGLGYNQHERWYRHLRSLLSRYALSPANGLQMSDMERLQFQLPN